MNRPSARSSSASWPHSTTNRAPDSLAPRAKSMPSPAPTSSCGRGSNAKLRGLPQRRSSTLLRSSAPSGTSSASTLGKVGSSASWRAWSCAQLLLALLHPLLECRHLGQELRRGLLALARALADLARQAVARRLRLLQLGLQRAPARIQLQDRRRRGGMAATGQGPVERGGLLAQPSDVDHAGRPLIGGCRRRARRPRRRPPRLPSRPGASRTAAPGRSRSRRAAAWGSRGRPG